MCDMSSPFLQGDQGQRGIRGLTGPTGVPGPVGVKVSLLLRYMCTIASQSSTLSGSQKQLFQSELASQKSNFKKVQQRLLLARLTMIPINIQKYFLKTFAFTILLSCWFGKSQGIHWWFYTEIFGKIIWCMAYKYMTGLYFPLH